MGVRTGSSVIVTVRPYDPEDVRACGYKLPVSRQALRTLLVSYEVPSVVEVSNSLISVNCRIRSAAAAGLS